MPVCLNVNRASFIVIRFTKLGQWVNKTTVTDTTFRNELGRNVAISTDSASYNHRQRSEASEEFPQHVFQR